MKKILYSLLLVVLLTGLLSGCAAPTPTVAPVATEAPATQAPAPLQTEAATEVSTPVTITDALGRTINLDKLPTRIAITGKAGFMITNAAFLFSQAPERIIAYVPGGQTPNDFISIMFPRTSSMTQLDTEAGPEQVAPLNPDLVLMKSYLKDKLGAQFEQIGINVVYLDLETADAITKDIRTLGQVFGDSERAEQLVGLFDQSVKKVTDVTSTLTEDQKPSVLTLRYSDKGGEIAFSVPPQSWLQTSVVELAGGIPVWKDIPTDGWTVVTFEQISAWNPEVILLLDYKGNALETVYGLKQDAKWSLLNAVKNGRIYAFPLDFQSWDQPDTRWALGMTWVATKLHPDLFSDVKMYDEILNFYSSFYSLPKNVIDEKILPLVKGDL